VDGEPAAVASGLASVFRGLAPSSGGLGPASVPLLVPTWLGRCGAGNRAEPARWAAVAPSVMGGSTGPVGWRLPMALKWCIWSRVLAVQFCFFCVHDSSLKQRRGRGRVGGEKGAAGMKFYICRSPPVHSSVNR
jgi:hypothetical protein